MLIAKSHYRQKEDIQLRSAKFNFNLFHLVPVQGFPLDLDETLHQRCLNLLNLVVQVYQLLVSSICKRFILLIKKSIISETSKFFMAVMSTCRHCIEHESIQGRANQI